MPEAIVRRRYTSGYLLANHTEMEIIGNYMVICGSPNRWLSSIFAATILYKLVFMEKLQSNLFFPLAGIAAVASLASCSNKRRPAEQLPLNIVYIMTDDHTAQMMSCYDTRYMETPNLDRIAADGVRFTQSFVANSLSGPSRACMITGKHSCATNFSETVAENRLSDSIGG